MKLYLQTAIFNNKAPFDNLRVDFEENEISILTAINGRGKTTFLSHIVDAIYEMARPSFGGEFEDRSTKYYRVSSVIQSLDLDKPSIVYFRFKLGDENIDYIDLVKRENSANITEDYYNEKISLRDKIPLSSLSAGMNTKNDVKKLSNNLPAGEKVVSTFRENVITYFPSYRYESPGYLTDPYKIDLSFIKNADFFGHMINPIEVVSGLPSLANWFMDVLLDVHRLTHNKQEQEKHLKVYNLINQIFSLTLSQKYSGGLRIDVGERNMGGARLQLGDSNSDSWKTIYPTIFSLSSGEASVVSIFAEILRQADRLGLGTEKVSGIVLIDEIDKHLHIKLQKEVLPRLFNLFPNVQFIVSSHSPFVSMGLAEKLASRTKIIDLDNGGISKDPTTNELYAEAYEAMISENERFKSQYDSLLNKIKTTKPLQIITEGKNTEHIKKAIETLKPSLLSKINIVSGAEDKTGSSQLKQAFDILSKAQQANHFLFIWDFDAKNIANSLNDTNNFKCFAFEENQSNAKIKKGIENLYPDDLFTKDLYSVPNGTTDYGGTRAEEFNKNDFLVKIKQINDPAKFSNFNPLVTKIDEILSTIESSVVQETV